MSCTGYLNIEGEIKTYIVTARSLQISQGQAQNIKPYKKYKFTQGMSKDRFGTPVRLTAYSHHHGVNTTFTPVNPENDTQELLYVPCDTFFSFSVYGLH